MYFITTKRMLEVCFSAHPNIQYRTVYIYRTILHMSRLGGFPPGLNGPGFSYIGSRPSYMRLSSPYTWPQFRIGIVHFFVASNVDKYSAFKRAVSLGNTLL